MVITKDEIKALRDQCHTIDQMAMLPTTQSLPVVVSILNVLKEEVELSISVNKSLVAKDIKAMQAMILELYERMIKKNINDITPVYVSAEITGFINRFSSLYPQGEPAKLEKWLANEIFILAAIYVYKEAIDRESSSQTRLGQFSLFTVVARAQLEENYILKPFALIAALATQFTSIESVAAECEELSRWLMGLYQQCNKKMPSDELKENIKKETGYYPRVDKADDDLFTYFNVTKYDFALYNREVAIQLQEKIKLCPIAPLIADPEENSSELNEMADEIQSDIQTPEASIIPSETTLHPELGVIDPLHFSKDSRFTYLISTLKNDPSVYNQDGFLINYRQVIIANLETYLNQSITFFGVSTYLPRMHSVEVQHSLAKIKSTNEVVQNVEKLFELRNKLKSVNSLNALPLVDKTLNEIYDHVYGAEPVPSLRR